MDVGVQMVFASYGWENVSDEEVWDEELRLARLAADLGFDVLWSVEHHFNDYSFCPDNLQLMSYLAAECPEVGLGTAAVILPWHDPLRVAEQVSVLDHLSRGRLRLGIGRGLARREFEAFRGHDGRIERAVRRGVRDDPARPSHRVHGGRWAVLPAAEDGDPPAPEAKLRRPRLRGGLLRRLGGVGGQAECAHGDVRRPALAPAHAGHPEAPRAGARGHREEAGPPLLADFCVCTPTLDGAEAVARQYMGKFVESNFYHYELLGPHFGTVKGYDAYAQKIAMAREIGMDGIVSAFMEAAVWGTPDRILRKLEERRTIVGDFELATSFRFGGTPFDLAESGLRLYAKEVLPVVHSWSPAVPES